MTDMVESQQVLSSNPTSEKAIRDREELKVLGMKVVSMPNPSHHSADTETLLKCLDMDPYDEDETELRFLHSKPTCFIIIGKPGSGKTTLARRLALEWKCELIHPTDIIQTNVDLQTEMGVRCAQTLSRGQAVPEDMVFDMIENKINSPESAHRGYVLDDFPCISENVMTIKDQLELVKNWKLKPDFIINIKIPDKDLEKRRIGQRFDPVAGNIYTMEVYNPVKPKENPNKEQAEEEGDEEEGEKKEAPAENVEEIAALPSEIVSRLIKRIEDMPQQVEANIQTHKSNMLQMLEDYMEDSDQQYLIEMDGNQTQFFIFKQLMQRLNCFVLRPAAAPLHLSDPERKELQEEIETEKLMRMMAPKQMVGPHFRWRRSKWLRFCPVALREGNIVPGKAEFIVGFLDKMYCLSSVEAMDKFFKNPRPYLLPPQPRPPCKLSVLGPPLSGKTSLSHLVAQKYAAKVLDIDALIKPRLEKECNKLGNKAREDATENAMEAVKARLKENFAAEAAARQAEGKTAIQDNDSSKTDEESPHTEEDTTSKGREKAKQPEDGETTQENDTEAPSVEPEVDASHPDVVAAVEAAIKDTESQQIKLPTEVYIEVLEDAIKLAEKEMSQTIQTGPIHGGWVLDNFPRTQDQWNVCVEKNLIPDDVIVLSDGSNQGQLLLKRFYHSNKKIIDSKIKKRVEEEHRRENELAERRRQEEECQALEEANWRAEEERLKKGAEEQERDNSVDESDEKNEELVHDQTEDRAVSIEEREESNDIKDQDDSVNQGQQQILEDTGLTRDAGSDEEKPEEAPKSVATPEAKEVSHEDAFLREKELILEEPELDDFKESRKTYNREFPKVVGVITGGTSINPVTVDLGSKNVEEVLEEVAQILEKPYKYSGWEYSVADIEEEEENLEADAAEDEEGGEEEDPNHNKKPLGHTNHFCPVSLKENNVLHPGNPEVAVKYREKIYYFSNADAKDKFLATPNNYIPQDAPLKPPPPRLLILGPKGAGKTMYGRNLANKLGLFHISFKDYLQELIIVKTKKKIGPEFEGDQEGEVEEEDEEEEGERIRPESDQDAEEDLSEVDQEVNSKEQQQEELELTEEEEAIKFNLESDEPLPVEVLENIVPQWWNKEPFKSTGFILEGFPRTQEEAKYLAEVGLFPDCAIILAVEDNNVINRLLPPKLDKWKVKRDQIVAKKMKKKEKAKKKWESFIQKRREELLNKQKQKRKERWEENEAFRSEHSQDEEDESEEESEDEDDIEAVLAEEFEDEDEEEEEDGEELEEDAIDRIMNEINEVYDKDTFKLAAIQKTLKEVLIPRYEVDGNRRPHIVRYLINKKIKPFIEYRRSIFERVYPIGEKLAKKMLQSGYKQPSRFGRWCPVKLKEGDCIQPMSGPGFPTYPCIYNQHIYFLSSLLALDDFVLDPIAYLTQPSPKPVVPITLAITGPPKSGKTTLANRFVDEYGLLRLSIGEAMRQVLTSQPNSDLATQMVKFLVKGLTVPDELAVQALDICLLNMTCHTRGYVLDGFPITKHQVDLMTEHGILPVRVVELCIDSKETMARGSMDRVSTTRTMQLLDSSHILAMKLAAYNCEILSVREWYKKEHNNYIGIPADKSKWWVWYEVLRFTYDSVKQIQTYLQRVSDGMAVSIANMCITPTEIHLRMGDFGHYCPVCLAKRGELVDCSRNPTLEFAAEFRGHYYKTAGQQELDEFLSKPEKFVRPLAPRQLPLPELLPKQWKPENVKACQDIELQSFCPVTFLDGKCRSDAVIQGNPELVAEYKGKFYYFESEEKLLKFMKSPEQYRNLCLPDKLPPCKDPPEIRSLPVLGFLEQTTAMVIIKSATAAGNVKPKYPFLNTSRSALFYMAYHLKAYNPKSSDYIRKKYKKKMEKFEETCQLIKYLGNTMSLRYKEPVERPQDFDIKLETFFSWKGVEPTPTWIA